MKKEQISLSYVGKNMEDLNFLLKTNEGKFKTIQSIEAEGGTLIINLLVKPEEEQARLLRVEDERKAALEKQNLERELELQKKEEEKKKEIILKELVKKEHEEEKRKAEEEKTRQEEEKMRRRAEALESLKNPNTPIEDVDFEILSEMYNHSSLVNPSSLFRTISYLLYQPLFEVPGIKEHVIEKLKGRVSQDIIDSLSNTEIQANVKFTELPRTGYANALCREIIGCSKEVVGIHDWVAYTIDGVGRSEYLGVFVKLKSERDLTIGDIKSAYERRINYLKMKKDKTKEDYEMSDENIFMIDSLGAIDSKESSQLVEFLREFGIIPKNKYVFLQ